MFPLDLISQRPPSLWRYEEALPAIPPQARVSFQEGFTPLMPYRVGKTEVMLKLDFLFPTGSYKDRGATVLISQARLEGITSVVQDSSGNAGCSIAGYAAHAQMSCTIFVPADTSPAKIAQIEMYGAKIVKVQGNREDTARACLDASKTTYYASHVYNDLFLEGTKTFAFEVCEQLTSPKNRSIGWDCPDAVVLPAGNGTLILGCYKGFTELLAAGVINKMPKLIAIQAKNCAPLYHAFHDLPAPEKWDTTWAEGIAIAEPKRAIEMLEAVRNTQGTFLMVEEEAIKTQLFELARRGFYVEPTSACVIAGLVKYESICTKPEKIVSVLTGTGLKATEKIQKII